MKNPSSSLLRYAQDKLFTKGEGLFDYDTSISFDVATSITLGTSQDRLFGKLRASFQNFYSVISKIQLAMMNNNQNRGEPDWSYVEKFLFLFA